LLVFFVFKWLIAVSEPIKSTNPLTWWASTNDINITLLKELRRLCGAKQTRMKIKFKQILTGSGRIFLLYPSCTNSLIFSGQSLVYETRIRVQIDVPGNKQMIYQIITSDYQWAPMCPLQDHIPPNGPAKI
jgi:hypothetical protein